MSDYIRRLVSGNKARFKDDKLNLELDLVYVTDQIIIMGYPASGIEGFYRNRREDAVRFLETRHGKNYWVFNFCPTKENSYEAEVFGGKVSRYPFPDHHAPPLAIMPLVAREIDAWLTGSPERVAVLHCKAGKGRSGTMACAYLLSLDDPVTPPKLERSHTGKQWAAKRMHDAVSSIPPDEEQQSATPRLSPVKSDVLASDTAGVLDHDSGSPPLSAVANPEKSFTDALKGVLDLHTARRMKPAEKEGKVKPGVSIPSQRRFLYYWALLLAHDAPQHLWSVEPPLMKDVDPKATPSLFQQSRAFRPKVRLTQIKLRMHETSNMKLNLVKAANKLLERTSMAKGPNNSHAGAKTIVEEKDDSSQVWASLARYNDDLVDLLEEWEVYMRDPNGRMGKRRDGSELLPRGQSTEEEGLNNIFKDGKWDKAKMVKSFARFGSKGREVIQEETDDNPKLRVFTLKPLSDKRWEGLKHDLNKTTKSGNKEMIDNNAEAVGVSQSEANSMNDVSTARLENSVTHGVILDAGREIRIKLYMGQVFMGWFWFIPTFHMPQPPPSPGSSPSSDANTHKASFYLARKDIDFPIGIGSAIVDVSVEMEWLPPPLPGTTATAVEVTEPPVRSHTEDSHMGIESDPEQTGLAAAVQAAIGGGIDEHGEMGTPQGMTLRETIEARQGADG